MSEGTDLIEASKEPQKDYLYHIEADPDDYAGDTVPIYVRTRKGTQSWGTALTITGTVSSDASTVRVTQRGNTYDLDADALFDTDPRVDDPTRVMLVESSEYFSLGPDRLIMQFWLDESALRQQAIDEGRIDADAYANPFEYDVDAMHDVNTADDDDEDESVTLADFA